MDIKTNFYGKFYLGTNAISSFIAKEDKMWDNFLQAPFDTYVNKDSIVIECGSSCGTHSIYLARLCKKLYCFEPQIYSFDLLNKNIELNEFKNVETFNLAVYSENCDMDFLHSEPDYTRFNHCDSESFVKKDGGKIKAIKLDDFFTGERELDSLTLIKTDAQDCDAEILKGAINLIKKFKPVIITEIEGNECTTEFYNLLKEVNYRYENFGKSDYIAFPN